MRGARAPSRLLASSPQKTLPLVNQAIALPFHGCTLAHDWSQDLYGHTWFPLEFLYDIIQLRPEKCSDVSEKATVRLPQSRNESFQFFLALFVPFDEGQEPRLPNLAS